MSSPGSLLARFTAALLLGTGSASATSPPSVQISTDVREDHYAVQGNDAAEIFASIGRRKLGARAGLTASGLTESQLSFTLSTTEAQGVCRVEAIELRAAITVTLPRHAHPNTLSPRVRRAWGAYEALVEYHEYTHVEIEFQGVQELLEDFERAPIDAVGASEICHAAVERKIDAQRRKTRDRHEAFHRREDASLRTAQGELKAEIDALDRELRAQAAVLEQQTLEITALGGAADELVLALEGLGRQLGPEAPPAAFAHYEDLERELAAAERDRDALVAQREEDAAHYDARLAERRRLVERLSWTR